jgi:hypothetical protein
VRRRAALPSAGSTSQIAEAILVPSAATRLTPTARRLPSGLSRRDEQRDRRSIVSIVNGALMGA